MVVPGLRSQHQLPVGDCWHSERVLCLHRVEARKYPRTTLDAIGQTSVVRLDTNQDATSIVFWQAHCTLGPLYSFVRQTGRSLHDSKSDAKRIHCRLAVGAGDCPVGPVGFFGPGPGSEEQQVPAT